MLRRSVADARCLRGQPGCLAFFAVWLDDARGNVRRRLKPQQCVRCEFFRDGSAKWVYLVTVMNAAGMHIAFVLEGDMTSRSLRALLGNELLGLLLI